MRIRMGGVLCDLHWWCFIIFNYSPPPPRTVKSPGTYLENPGDYYYCNTQLEYTGTVLLKTSSCFIHFWSSKSWLLKITQIFCNLIRIRSVSDPHTLNANPDLGLWLNTDPGSQYLILIKQKKILIAVFSGISQHLYLIAEPYGMLSLEKLIWSEV